MTSVQKETPHSRLTLGKAVKMRCKHLNSINMKKSFVLLPSICCLRIKNQMYFLCLVFVEDKPSIYNTEEKRLSFLLTNYSGAVFTGTPKFSLKEKGELYV